MLDRSRWFLLGPFLAHVVLGGCSADESDGPEPTVSSSIEVTDESTPPKRCDDDSMGVEPVGQATHVQLRAELVTKSCRCEYLTTPQWSCSNTKVCESEYDLGSENPQKCDEVGRERVAVLAVEASADRDDCLAAAALVPNDPGSVDVTVLCASEGVVYVDVRLHTDHGEKDSSATLRFTDGGKCPARDAGARDAGDADRDAGPDADPDADAGD